MLEVGEDMNLLADDVDQLYREEVMLACS